nr:AAA family ATPase [Neoroseomonas oryzicola]
MLGAIDPRTWTSPAPSRQWIVPDWFPRGVVTAVYGDGGVGKTLLAQQLLTSVALGKPWCEVPVTKGRVLGIFCEDDTDELHRRQEAINRAYGCDMLDLGSLRLVSRFGEDNAMVRFDRNGTGTLTEFHGLVMATCDSWRPDVLVLDTAADLYPDNENERPKVRWFIQAGLGRIARAFNCSVVLLAHPSQSGIASGEGTGGSTAWNNTVRSRLYLVHEGGSAADPNARILSRKKANYAGRNADIRLVWRDGALIRDDNVAAAGLSAETLDTLFDEIERAWRRGSAWSHSPQTRRDGRYFPAWVHDQFRIPERATVELVAKWLRDGVLTSDLVDPSTKKRGLRVVRRPDDAF